MARLGRSVPNRPIVAKGRFTLQVNLQLAAFETADEFPPLTVTTPNANLFLAAFETGDEFPALTLSYEQNLVLAAFETADEFPSLTVAIPVLPGDLISGNYQIEYNGVLFGGHGNQFQIIAGSVEGWDDLPAMDSGNVPRPTWHGSWGARVLAQERQITATIALTIGPGDDFNGNLAALRRLLTPPEGDTYPSLVISTRDEVLLSLEAVVDSRTMPMRDYHVGWVPVAIRWTCPDPRRYNVDRTGATVAVGTQVMLQNAGNVATHPLIRIDGPTTNPALANADTSRTLDFLLTLADGERLEIDTLNGTALVGDDSAMSALTGTSAPVFDFVLAQGDNRITYSADAGGGRDAVFLYRDAWL